MTSDRKRPTDKGTTVPLMEESAAVKKRWATTGKVQVVTHTETVEELARAVLDGEEVEIQTVELDQTVSVLHLRSEQKRV